MPLFDLYCEKCETKKIDVWLKTTDDLPMCEKCNIQMKKICTFGTFKLLFDPKKDTVAWGSQGYARSAYWDDYKKAKEQGRKVKPFGED